jgi:pyruvate formate lyase activating enzyme
MHPQQRQNPCHIKGFQGTSLIDYPGRIASILFTGGCTFRCRYCYNRSLLTVTELPDLDVDMILATLKTRRNFIEGVVVTGGEPTLHPGLIDLLCAIRRIGLDVKLDTNGTHPEILEWIIEDNLAEYIAMDYKAPLNKLEDVACIRGAEKRVAASAHLLMARAKRYEFRTTVHPLLHTREDLFEIAEELGGARSWHLQQFHAVDPLDPALRDTAPYPAAFILAIGDLLKPRFGKFSVRNLRDTGAGAHGSAPGDPGGASPQNPSHMNFETH